jgi:dTDP-4-amino-4,6-dideoxygalactose transaminase
MDKIPFNRPFMTGRELFNIAQAHFNGMLAGDGPFTKRCHETLERRCGSPKALLTHSCTAALEMSALLAEIRPDDEVIMPAYTFVSTANAFVLRGAKPVFVDIRADTLNIDETLIEERIGPRTRAIVVVHYAGVACEMDAIVAIARRRGLLVIEDAAQALLSTYRGRQAGALGDLGTLSFHETKNVIAGEGGALLVNRADWVHRAEIVRDKGTNRSQFFRGEVDKYTWRSLGSSFLPGELIAAFLSAQLDEMDQITSRRRALWCRYHTALAPLEEGGHLRRPSAPAHCEHNAHMYYLLLPDVETRTALIAWLAQDDIHAVFHYVSLHRSEFGCRFHGKDAPDLPNSERASDTLLRLPMWLGLEDHQQRVIARIERFFSSSPSSQAARATSSCSGERS